jgi:FemAB-related protein (PEP-CTERM system-associated)
MPDVNILSLQDEEQWNSYVENHPSATPYHRTAWKNSVEQGYQHKCYYWVAKNDDNKVVGVLPTTWIKTPFSTGSLCALPYCDVGGILADNEKIEVDLLDTALKFCQKNKIKTFDNRSSMPSKLTFDDTSEISKPKVRMLMPFPENSEALFSNFKSKLRSQIRKSEKNGLTASTGRDVKHLDGFYQVFTRNMRDLGSPVHSKKWFEQIVEQYADNMIIANVYSENIVVGAGIVLFNKGKACIPWASTNADYNKLAPNMLLYWTLLKYSNDNNCEEFDFGRSTLDEGTYRFKGQWGAKPVLLNWQKYDNQGQTIAEQTGDVGKLRKIVETTWKKLPVGISEFIGPKIRKYISL